MSRALYEPGDIDQWVAKKRSAKLRTTSDKREALPSKLDTSDERMSNYRSEDHGQAENTLEIRPDRQKL
jgi:hypothetical protein